MELVNATQMRLKGLHQRLGEHRQAILGAFAMPHNLSNRCALRLLAFLAASVVHLVGCAAEKIPVELIGVWGYPSSEFHPVDGALEKGAALVVLPGGMGLFVHAPPPIGAIGPVTYDPDSRVLHLNLLNERGSPRGITCRYSYDATARTPTGGGELCGNISHGFRHEHVPQYWRNQIYPRK